MTLLLVSICPSPEPDLLLVDRLLARAKKQGMKTALIVGKCDLDGGKLLAQMQEEYRGADCPVLGVSARNKEGLDSVRALMRGADCCCLAGQSGVGKSTLLKAISGIMQPTEGEIEVNGRIAALLELTSGFDAELTVRENTYLRGALLGYSRKFMHDTYDRIIEFAELEDFQDRQFKQLSSGMKSRLAFSIACLVSPDILILDEVLSVGDGAFRQKSEARMRQILQSGVTGVLVSHSLEQVRDMCNKVLWLDHGRQMGFGGTKEICDAYEEFLSDKQKEAK